MEILETEYQDIYKDQWLSETEKFLRGTPSNYIIFKKLPGLGATHGEIKIYLWRHSIITEPNQPVIEGKGEELDEEGNKVYPNMFGVYKGVSKKQVIDYLKSAIWPKKIVCTPEAFTTKVKPAIDETDGFDLYNDFFLLLDECDKLTTENDYRDKIIAPMKDFFLFKDKAMISATALVPSDERFAQQGFKILEIRPQFDYSVNLNLVHTNNVLESIGFVMNKYNDGCYFIFVNSVKFAYVVMKALDIVGKSKVFCSSNSFKTLREVGFHNFSSNLGDYETYNILTSRFYSAVDIKLSFKPHVMILTNVLKAPHSIIDPYTDSVQIVGRFRNGFDKATHITNFNPAIEVINPKQARLEISDGYLEYKRIANRIAQVQTLGARKALTQATQRIDIKKFVDDQHELMSFMVDNHIHEQKIRGYFKANQLLLKAYQAVSYFSVNPIPFICKVSDNQLYDMEFAKNRQARIERIATFINDLSEIEKENKIVYSLGTTMRDIEKNYPEIIQYVNVLGYDCLKELEFNERRIKIKVFKTESNAKLYDARIVKEAQSWYKVGEKPLQRDSKQKLEKLFSKYSINIPPKGTAFLKYYEADISTDVNGDKVWIIKGIRVL
jgi:hypothetical protein